MKLDKLPKCPFCGGKVIHTRCDKNTRTPDMIQCVGDCFFEIMCDYKKDESLKWYLKHIKEN